MISSTRRYRQPIGVAVGSGIILGIMCLFCIGYSLVSKGEDEPFWRCFILLLPIDYGVDITVAEWIFTILYDFAIYSGLLWVIGYIRHHLRNRVIMLELRDDTLLCMEPMNQTSPIEYRLVMWGMSSAYRHHTVYYNEIQKVSFNNYNCICLALGDGRSLTICTPYDDRQEIADYILSKLKPEYL